MSKKKPKNDPARESVRKRVEGVAREAMMRPEALDRMRDFMSHDNMHCAETRLLNVDRTTRTEALANPNQGSVTAVCLGRLLDDRRSERDEADVAYFPTELDQRMATASAMLRNSRRITSFYCDNKAHTAAFDVSSPAPETNADSQHRWTGCVLRHDRRTGAIRELEVSDARLVLKRGFDDGRGDFGPKAGALAILTSFPMEGRAPAHATGRDLRKDVSLTKSFAESSRLRKAWLLSCCDPNVTPVETQMLRLPGGQDFLRIPLGQGRPRASIVIDDRGVMLESKRGELLSIQDERVQSALRSHADTYANEYAFLSSVSHNMRDTDRFVPELERRQRRMPDAPTSEQLPQRNAEIEL